MSMRHPPPTYRPLKLLANTHQNEILVLEMTPSPQKRESVASKEADRLRLLGEPATRIQLSSTTLYKGIGKANNKGDMSLLNDKGTQFPPNQPWFALLCFMPRVPCLLTNCVTESFHNHYLVQFFTNQEINIVCHAIGRDQGGRACEVQSKWGLKWVPFC